MLDRFRALPYQRQVLVVYGFAVFMTVIDGTMVNVALPAMGRDFHVPAENAEFVAIGYLLAVAAIIPAAGWLSDRFGTRRVLLVSLVLFVLASLACATAQTLPQLIFVRVLQGLGGGLMAPVGSTIMFRAFPLHQRATAAAAVLSVSVSGPAIGPLLGGFLVDAASWHWIFLINLPVGIIAFTLAFVSLKADIADDPGRLDVVGLVLSAGSITSLLYALTQGATSGWLSRDVIVFGLAGAGGLGLLVWVETHVAQPMLALRLFRDRLFRDINVSSALMYMGFFGYLFVLPIYLQQLRGYSAFQSGLVGAPQALGIMFVSVTIAKRAYRSIGPRRLIIVFGVAAGLITCAFGLADLNTSPWLLAGLALLRGFAMGFVFIAVQTAVYSTTSNADTGRATSLFNTQRQMSYATGVAIGSTVLAALMPERTGVPDLHQLSAYRWAFVAVGLIMIPGALWAFRLHDSDVAGTLKGAPVPPDAELELSDIE